MRISTIIRFCVPVLLVAFAFSQRATAIEGNAAAWGARNPGACSSVRLTKAPTPAQAAAMIRCKHEIINEGSGELWLMENLNVTVGAPIPFVVAYNTYVMDDADVRQRVYPLRGSYTWSVCKSRHDAGIYGNPDLNCRETDVVDAKGACWKTSFGDWRCLFRGTSQGRREPTRPPKVIAVAPR